MSVFGSTREYLSWEQEAGSARGPERRYTMGYDPPKENFFWKVIALIAATSVFSWFMLRLLVC